MKLFDMVLTDRQEIASQAEQAAEDARRSFAEAADVRAALVKGVIESLREFVEDLPGLECSGYEAAIDSALHKIDEDMPPQEMEQLRDILRSDVASFARQKREYVEERDQEYRRLIEWLTTTTRTCLKRDHAFQDDLLGTVERVEQASVSGDIYGLRRIVQTEMGELRARTEKKSQEDREQVQNLVERVSELQARLANAEEQAVRDKLTGLQNRHALDEKLIAMLRSSSPFCLVMVDLNDFKTINDTYGHVMGDRCLRTAASLLEQAFRAEDFVARFGGDEFVVIAEAASKNVLAGRISRVFPPHQPRAYRFDQGDETISVQLSSSFGIASRRDDDTPESILARADERLYQAKKAGKNLVHCE